MANYEFSPPEFAKDAVPTLNGWVDPKSGEVLVSYRRTFEELQALYARLAADGHPAFAKSPGIEVEATVPTDDEVPLVVEPKKKQVKAKK